jgi:hypothetical protein
MALTGRHFDEVYRKPIGMVMKPKDVLGIRT